MDNIYICDIDGTLAKAVNRNPYDESKVFDDEPLPTVEIIKSLLATGERIIYFSGRTEACRQDTINWLTKHVSTDYPELYMRWVSDKRNDAILKAEMYELYIKGKYNVLGVFDDRLRVCRMWYDLGLFVYNVNQGLREF